MAYLAKFTVRAKRDLAELFHEKNAAESNAAPLWYLGLIESTLTLEDHPNHCPVAPESPTLRQLPYGKKPHIYRVIYRILAKRKVVEILHIRHSAREKFNSLK